MHDPYNLNRFVSAQESGGTYDQALAELQRGNKAGHWMWFIFPQISGLGQSPTSRLYAIRSMAEAQAYLKHELLGPRLLECGAAVATHTGRPATDILGGIDARKLHSSMTLFLHAAPEERIFREVLDQFFDGQPDTATESLLLSDKG
ncbi:DUF1810 domain-containing protein [Arthrobacter sp. ISL-48]|uniref:DUF1810 domain-containing protein n=1 Tax=Arthrobacter sp. ISL-48 TaxID=2819110 RepID=UPI001BE9EF22|nr:DUF1810 domain-containing protein [Arthrobacter sp. ISL-48]MBT2531496.1 DUF1810 domain-containing protein [Arthrobacter sp. ISL-48]